VSVSSDGGADAIRVANPARAKSAKNSDSAGFVANAVNHTEDLSFNEELLETSDYSMETQRARKPECTVTRATSGRHATEAPAISCMGHLSATTRAAAVIIHRRRATLLIDNAQPLGTHTRKIQKVMKCVFHREIGPPVVSTVVSDG
jgi:hypothetical protein